MYTYHITYNPGIPSITEIQAGSHISNERWVWFRRDGHPGDVRRFLHGVVYLVRTGIPWRDLPPRFGHWNSVFRRFRRWCRAARRNRPRAAAGAATAPSCTSWWTRPDGCCACA